jgi:hypothetical protein
MVHALAAMRGRTRTGILPYSLTGEPTLEDRSALSDIGFDLMLEHGQYVQAVAIDAARSPERSYFVSNVLKDGLAA